MYRRTFDARLRKAAQKVLQFAREHVKQSLPDDVAFLVYPNQSCDDNPRVVDEVTFPDESLPKGQYHGPWSAEQVANFLWRAGKVPEWIDAAVQGEDGERTLIGLRCCGRFTAKEKLLYHRFPGGFPPFLIKSPVLPPSWESVEASGKFDLHWRPEKPRPTQVVRLGTVFRRLVSTWFGRRRDS